MKEKNPVLYGTIDVLIGELVAAVLTVGVYAALSAFGVVGFTYTVLTGAILGVLVTTGNFYFLSRATDRAFSEAEAERGTKEMSEEEIEEFTARNKAKIQAAILKSQLIRTVSMLAALVLAFVLPWFDGIAAAVPLLAFRPVLMAREAIERRGSHGRS